MCECRRRRGALSFIPPLLLLFRFVSRCTVSLMSCVSYMFVTTEKERRDGKRNAPLKKESHHVHLECICYKYNHQRFFYNSRTLAVALSLSLIVGLFVHLVLGPLPPPTFLSSTHHFSPCSLHQCLPQHVRHPPCLCGGLIRNRRPQEVGRRQ